MSNNLVSTDHNPLFEFESFDDHTYESLFIEYNEKESLFRFYLPCLIEFFEECDISPEVAQIWYHAKKFTQTLCSLNYPENYFERIESTLICGPASYDFSNAVLFCMFEMMQTNGVNSNHKFDKAIEKLQFRNWKTNVAKKEVKRLREAYPDDQSMWSSEREVINDFMKYYLRNVPCAIQQGEVIEDYDYSKPDPFFTTSEDADDQERIKESLGTDEVTENSDSKTQSDKEYAQKVRMELLCKFLEDKEIDFKQYGKKANIARLINIITGISEHTAKNYLTERSTNYNNVKITHTEQIEKINLLLVKIGLDFKL